MHESGALWVNGPHVNMWSTSGWVCTEKRLKGNVNEAERAKV